jgi:hypothetical protein
MLIKNKPTGSAMITTIFLLMAILTISIIGLDIILSGLAARRAQGASARAYYAAEAGIERAVMAFKLDKVTSGQPLFNRCSSFTGGGYLKFCSDSNNGNNCDVIDPSVVTCDDAANPSNQHAYRLNNDPALPTYWVRATITGPGRYIELNSRGNYMDTSRELYVKFCLPDCENKATGADDGCGGTCK